MVVGEDYYIDENNNYVFTSQYHLKRGYCCKNKCRHCPWSYGKQKTKNIENQKK